MPLEQISEIAQIAASVGVIVSLVFVGLQVRQNTAALYRNEHNSTMEQWTIIRSAIVQSRDIAELMTSGLNGERTLDAADRLRLEQFLAEHAWASFHIWDRMQRGVFAKGTFELTAGPLLAQVLHSGVRRRRRRGACQTLGGFARLSLQRRHHYRAQVALNAGRLKIST
jgi:hypothetical protein